MTSENEAPEYEELVTEAPVRETESLEQESKEEAKTLGERLDEASDLTDLQYAVQKLFPKTVELNDVMIARVAPEGFLALLHIMTNNEIMRSDPSKPIDVNGTLVRNYIPLTVGLDGRGRIDMAELVGAAREEKKAIEGLGGLGLGG